MPAVLRARAVSERVRQENDAGSSAWIVLRVFGMLSLFAYLFTDVGARLGLASPRALAAAVGLSPAHVFRRDGRIDGDLAIALAHGFDANVELLILFGGTFVAFSCAYLLPLRHKRPAIALSTATSILVLYGARATLALSFAHATVYLVLHPRRDRPFSAGAIWGLLGYGAFRPEVEAALAPAVEGILAAIAGATLYRSLIVHVLAHERPARVLRRIVVEAAMIVSLIGAAVEGFGGKPWSLPLGALLFFWQWERSIMYAIDREDGHVKEHATVAEYASTFLLPGAIANWTWGVTIGQGGAYANDAFLRERKNVLVSSGLRLMAIALLYLVLGDWIRYALVDLFARAGIDAHAARTTRLVEHFMKGGRPSAASVLSTTMLDLVRWLMLWGGVVHFKVGASRICGFAIDPYFDRPFLATNLVSFWARFTFHYREFLVRAFYYPVFLRFFRGHRNLRVFAATMASACLGNLVWGHVSERLLYRGLRFENITYVLATWPYFVALGTGIGITQVVLLARKRTRKPWTFGPWLVADVAAAYLTLQFYALITIFARPRAGATVRDLGRLFLIAFGIDL
jgi:hypothetical protein